MSWYMDNLGWFLAIGILAWIAAYWRWRAER